MRPLSHGEARRLNHLRLQQQGSAGERRHLHQEIRARPEFPQVTVPGRQNVVLAELIRQLDSLVVHQPLLAETLLQVVHLGALSGNASASAFRVHARSARQLHLQVFDLIEIDDALRDRRDGHNALGDPRSQRHGVREHAEPIRLHRIDGRPVRHPLGEAALRRCERRVLLIPVRLSEIHRGSDDDIEVGRIDLAGAGSRSNDLSVHVNDLILGAQVQTLGHRHVLLPVIVPSVLGGDRHVRPFAVGAADIELVHVRLPHVQLHSDLSGGRGDVVDGRDEVEECIP
ncbi:hypothetical protein CN359_30480 [Bacillus thuringiensis]|nr:hypothetical protein CN359_30480 [Bacillus thuringiensis]